MHDVIFCKCIMQILFALDIMLAYRLALKCLRKTCVLNCASCNCSSCLILLAQPFGRITNVIAEKQVLHFR